LVARAPPIRIAGAEYRDVQAQPYKYEIQLMITLGGSRDGLRKVVMGTKNKSKLGGLRDKFEGGNKRGRERWKIRQREASDHGLDED